MNSMSISFQSVKRIVVDRVKNENIWVLIWNNELTTIGIFDQPTSREIDIIQMTKGLMD